MELKQAGELRRYEDPDTGEEIIRDMVLKNVRFNYTYVSRPRPAQLGFGDGEGAYETVLYINEQEVYEKFAEYFQEYYERAVYNAWKGRRLALDKINLPFSVPEPKEDGTWGKFEEEAIIAIKTKTHQQPELFLRVDGPLRHATEEDLDEFYSGMIGDAVISLWAYPGGGSIKPGIKAYINGVCKTGKGEPIIFTAGNYNFVEAFGGEGDVSTAFSKEEAPVAQSLADIVGSTKPKVKKTPIKEKVKPAPDLLKQSQEVKPITQEPEETAPTNILQNLINKGLTK